MIRTIFQLTAAVVATCTWVTNAKAAHVGKFDKMSADVVYTSSANINDIERCLIRIDGAGGVPHVFSQPDRPNQRLIIWINDNNDASARVDLDGGSRTKVTAWRAVKKNPEEFEACAPHAL